MTSRVIQRTAQRAEDNPFFLAYALSVYRTGEGISSAVLARRLGCRLADLPRLALCRRPASTDASFAEDVRQIATWVAVDANVLMNIVRYAERVVALRRMRPQSGSQGGTLLAARDREHAEEDDPDA